MINVHSFYSLADGSILDHTFSSNEIGAAQRNCPEGYACIAGSFDNQSQRFDHKSESIVDYQPPKPDEDHEWIHDDEQGKRVRRWMKKPEVVEREQAIASAKQRIEELEASQPRAIREVMLSPSTDNRARLAKIDADIAEQRAIIQRNTPKK